MLYLTGVLTVAALFYLGYVMIRPENFRDVIDLENVNWISLCYIRSGRSGCRSPVRSRWAGGWPACSIRRPSASARGSTRFRSRCSSCSGRREPARMGWKQYAFAVLAFNAALFVISFAILLLQSHLPILNPDAKGPLTALGYKDMAGAEHPGRRHGRDLQHGLLVRDQHQPPALFRRAASFLFQPAGRDRVATVRHAGVRAGRDAGGDSRPARRARAGRLLPGHAARALFRARAAAVLVAGLLVATGVPMTLRGAVQAATLERGTQTIAVGPVAAEVAIKQLGTNGGGFFGPNSAHPFENPSPWSNLLEVISIIIVPMASIVMFGLMIKDRAHATVIFGVMLAMLSVGVTVAISAETQPSAAVAGLPVATGGNLEGKEVRHGPVASATWAAMTTATSSGSVNSMHDSFQPLGGLVPMALMMLNVDFSGIGAGFLNMLMYIIVAVFLAGPHGGRTPEYLGKKIEAREVKLAMIVVLIHPLLITCGTALFAASGWGKATAANPGSHGFSEVLYEFTSAAANNGSGFEGLADNNPAWNIATGVVLLLGRFPALVLPIAIAGFLAEKKRAPQTSGTLLTNDLTFAAMLLGTVLLVGALSFMPAVVLGPVADHLTAAPAGP